MNNILIPLLISSLAGLGTIIGSLFVFLPIKNTKRFITTALSFSGTVMILISIIDLIPPSVFHITNTYSTFIGLLLIFLPFLAGVILINTLDKIIQEESSLYKIGILSLVVLMIHNFPEGIATFMTSYVNVSLGIKLGIAIMLHNIPEGICIAVPIANSTHSRLKGVGMAALSSIAEPLGALTAYFILKEFINNLSISMILIFVAGIMITLSINKIYRESFNLNYKKSFLLGIVLSIVYIVITLIIN